MYIDSYQVSYPYEILTPGKRLSSGSFDFRIDRKPDYSFRVVELICVDDQGEHIAPLDQEVINQAERDGMTDAQIIRELRDLLAQP